MRKKAVLFMILLVVALLNLSAERVYALDSLTISPFSSVSYYGSYTDALTNPAALPMMKVDGSFLSSVLISDDLDIRGDDSDDLRFFQNHTDKLILSFLGNNLSLTGQFGSDFRNRNRLEDNLYFDIYNTIDIQIDWAYSFPYFSVGARLAGGNSMIRPSKPVSNLTDAYANALFSPFENDSGSARFSVGFGSLLYFRYGAVGLYTDRILGLSDGTISASWESILSSSTISFYAGGGRINRAGELSMLRPRLSYSYTGFTGNGSSVFDVKADLAFQFLPDFSIAFGISYREYSHRFFSFNRDNGYLGLYMKGNFASVYLLLGASLSAADFRRLTPVIGLTYIS